MRPGQHGESRVDDIERMMIQDACAALSIAYARHVDFAEYDECAELFADDGYLNAGGPLEGREKIRKGMHRRSAKLRSRHVLTNIHIDVLDADHARGISYLTLFRHIGEESLQSDPVEFDAPAAVGHYADDFVRTEEGWKIARRVLELAFRNSSKFG